MASTHFYDGPVLVSFNSLEIGYTRDGVEVTLEPRFADVHSDDWAGTSGAPSDTQFMGAIGTVHLDLIKFNKTNLDVIATWKKTGTAGVVLPFGTLMRQESAYAPLVLTGTKEVGTYNIAFPRSPQTMNKGMRVRGHRVSFEVWVNNPTDLVLYSFTTP